MLSFLGNVLFKATGDEIGKFLSLCKQNRVTIKDFQKNNAVCSGYIAPWEYKKASRLAKSVGVRLKVVKKNGILFLTNRYKKRTGLFISAVLAVAILIFLQNFVWAIDVYGNNEVSSSHILHTAKEQGLKIGLFLPTTDLEQIKLRMLRQLPSLSFLSLNRIGSRIEIELAEEDPKPYIIPNDTPCNIVALKTAQIISSEVYAGQKMFKEGDSVFKGDLLVSGIVESADGKTTYHHALAKVMAKTKFEKEFSISLNQIEKLYSGKEKTRYRFDVLGKKLPLFLAFPLKEKYESEKTLSPVKLFNITLPFGIEKEVLSFYKESPITFTEDEALELLKKNVALYEKEELKNAKILSREISAKSENGLLFLTVEYQCEEDICLKKPIETDLNPEIPVNP